MWRKTCWLELLLNIIVFRASVGLAAASSHTKKKWKGLYLIMIIILVALFVSMQFVCIMNLLRIMLMPPAATLNHGWMRVMPEENKVNFVGVPTEQEERYYSPVALDFGEMNNGWMISMIGENEVNPVNVPTEQEERYYSPAALGFGENETRSRESTLICDKSSYRTDVCIMKGDIRTHPASSTLFLVSGTPGSGRQEQQEQKFKIKPYTRKWDNITMASVDELSLETLTDLTHAPQCQVTHSVPALVFSTGGYTGNLFHDFTDVIVPLFIASYHLKGQVVFIILNHKPWWTRKFGDIIRQLSSYDILDFRKEINTETHCFPEAIVGLRFHEDLWVNPALTPYKHTITDFQKMLSSAFEDGNKRSILFKSPRPKLVLIARNRSRVFLNQKEIVEVAEKVGFRVIVLSPNVNTPMKEMYTIINSCDVLMGIHGAALTHFLFLPPGAVFVQVVPLGIGWASRTFFRRPAMKMDTIEYLEYQILPQESSLYDEYPKDHPYLRDPKSVNSKGWAATKKVYLDNQNVKLHLPRLQRIFNKALDLIHSRSNSSSSEQISNGKFVKV